MTRTKVTSCQASCHHRQSIKTCRRRSNAFKIGSNTTINILLRNPVHYSFWWTLYRTRTILFKYIVFIGQKCFIRSHSVLLSFPIVLDSLHSIHTSLHRLEYFQWNTQHQLTEAQLLRGSLYCVLDYPISASRMLMFQAIHSLYLLITKHDIHRCYS